MLQFSKRFSAISDTYLGLLVVKRGDQADALTNARITSTALPSWDFKSSVALALLSSSSST